MDPSNSKFAGEEATQFNILKNPYVDNFTSISGSDIVGTFGHVEFTNLQGVSISVNREVHPIYVMGHTDPTSFSRGKRGVAGSLVMIATDRGALYDIMSRWGVYSASVGDDTVKPNNAARTKNRMDQNALTFDNGIPDDNRYQLGFELAVPEYPDQLPPFDITLVGRSDSMSATVSRVGGLFIVSMGTGISVDDNSIEQQMTFVALFYEDWRPAGRRNWQDFEQRRQRREPVNPFSNENQGNDDWFDLGDQGDDLGDKFGLSGPETDDMFDQPPNDGGDDTETFNA